MTDFAVTCRAGGTPVDPTTLGTQLISLLKKLGEFGPIGRIKNDGSWYQATLVVTAPDEAEARRIAHMAVVMAASATAMPKWPIDTVEVFALAAA